MEDIRNLIKDKFVLPAPASSNDIIELETKYQIPIPIDIIDLFFKVSGTVGIEINNIFIYGTDKFKPLVEYLEEYRNIPGSEEFFVLADFSDWCWGYAINVFANKDEVFLVGRGGFPYIKVADSIEEFLQLSINNSSDLVG